MFTLFPAMTFFPSELHSDVALYLFQVVDVELHRDSLGEDYIPQPSSSKVTHRAASPTLTTSLAQTYGRSSSPVSHDSSVDKGTTADYFCTFKIIGIKYLRVFIYWTA